MAHLPGLFAANIAGFGGRVATSSMPPLEKAAAALASIPGAVFVMATALVWGGLRSRAAHAAAALLLAYAAAERPFETVPQLIPGYYPHSGMWYYTYVKMIDPFISVGLPFLLVLFALVVPLLDRRGGVSVSERWVWILIAILYMLLATAQFTTTTQWGYWASKAIFAPDGTPAFWMRPDVQTFVWLRMIGDIVAAAGIAVFLIYIVKGLPKALRG